jgi:hypothetical protein
VTKNLAYVSLKFARQDSLLVTIITAYQSI